MNGAAKTREGGGGENEWPGRSKRIGQNRRRIDDGHLHGTHEVTLISQHETLSIRTDSVEEMPAIIVLKAI